MASSGRWSSKNNTTANQGAPRPRSWPLTEISQWETSSGPLFHFRRPGKGALLRSSVDRLGLSGQHSGSEEAHDGHLGGQLAAQGGAAFDAEPHASLIAEFGQGGAFFVGLGDERRQLRDRNVDPQRRPRARRRRQRALQRFEAALAHREQDSVLPERDIGRVVAEQLSGLSVKRLLGVD